MPIREELSLSDEFYESLDEQAIDVTRERIDEACMLSQPLHTCRFDSSKAKANNNSIAIRQENNALQPMTILQSKVP